MAFLSGFSLDNPPPAEEFRLQKEGPKTIRDKSAPMAEVYIWAAAGTFALVGFGMAKRLGLLDEVPRDPKARVAGYAAGALAVIKDQLIGSQIQTWSEQRVEYVKKGTPSVLWVENGSLFCRQGFEQESFPLGDLGSLSFALSGDEMQIEISTAETGGARHTAQVSVPILSKSA